MAGGIPEAAGIQGQNRTWIECERLVVNIDDQVRWATSYMLVSLLLSKVEKGVKVYKYDVPPEPNFL